MLRRDDESPFFYSPTHTEVVFGGSVGFVGSVGFIGSFVRRTLNSTAQVEITLLRLAVRLPSYGL